MRLILLLAVVAIAGCGRKDAPPPPAPAGTVQQQVDQINQDAAEAQAEPGERGPDPQFEAMCRDVDRSEAAALEQRMKEQRDAGELVVLAGDEATLVSCSRYWERLERAQ